MKTSSFKKCKRSGLITILSVVVVGGFMLGMMAIMYRGSIRSLEAQKKVQLQIDYDARKQAFLRSVVTMAPVTVANTMIAGANANFEGGAGLFDIASSASKLGSARSPADEAGMNFPGTYKNGNTGNKTGFNVADYVTMVAQGGVAAATTPALLGNAVAFTKITYPDIHFGYYSLDAAGNKTFIARRNSWKINIQEAQTAIDAAGLSDDLLSDEYILDVYEIPAQLAISSSAFTNIGDIGNETYDADKVKIAGNIYAKKASLTHGAVAGVSTTQGATLAGATVGGYDADAVGGRTAHENANATFYPISKASDYARTLFLPINTGFNFFDRFATGDDDGDPVEPGWDTYSCGAHQCMMKLDIIEVIGGVPSALRFTLNGYSVDICSSTTSNLPGIDWPAASTTFPFLLEGGDVAIHPERLPAWLQTADGGGISSANVKNYHSIAVNADYKGTTADPANRPTTPTSDYSPFVVILRDCEDLTAFTDGFSIVTNYKLQILENLNQSAFDPDQNGVVRYPALSVFAPTIQYGLSSTYRSVSLTGSMGSLNQGDTAINILEMEDTSGGTSAAETFADLKPIEDIEDLPPINVMNWLVMIKKAD